MDLRAAMAGEERLRDIGDLAVELPRGARIWVHLGGPAAVTAETEMMMLVERDLRSLGWQQGGSKGPAPELLEYPMSVAEQEREALKVSSKADRWRQRHLPDNTTT